MNYSVVFVALLFGTEVLSNLYQIIPNRYVTISTEEEIIKRRIQTLSSNSLTVNPRLPFPQFPRLTVPFPTLTVPKLPELKTLPEVKSGFRFNKPELPTLKTLPAILTLGGKKDNPTPPRIGQASSSLQDLLNAAMSTNKQPQVKNSGYNSDEVWRNFRALQNEASNYIFELSTAQVLSLGLQNGQIGTPVLQNFNQNVQRTISVPSNNIILQNNGISGIGNLNSGIGIVNSGIGTVNSGIANVNSLQLNTVPVANSVQVVKNLPVSGIVTNNANNLITTNLNNNLVSANIGSNFVGTNLVSNVGLSNANLVNAVLPVNIANGFNINTGTFAVGNTGLSQFLPNGIPCGIQILADALEVGGAVAVTGQLPFYTTVGVNGVLPSSGSGIVNCGCA